mgnify:CR=1 FL=1
MTPPKPQHRPTRALLPPLDPQRFVPTRERPVRAKARQLQSDTEITPHSHAWAQVVVCASGVARTPGAEGGGRASFDNELLGRICRAMKR